MKNRIAAVLLAGMLGAAALTTIETVAPVDVTNVAAAEAHSGGCNPYVQNYPYYVQLILPTSYGYKILWVNVSTSSTHWHRCYGFYG